MEEPNYHLAGVVRAKSDSMEDFDGPLDVILLLLSKNKIAIKDIQIASILQQYLDYLDEMKRLDLEIASEFIAMASHLIYIKTKMLLSYSDQLEAMSEMELLIQNLQERQRKDAYEQIKTAVQTLEQRGETGLGAFVKLPEPLPKVRGYDYRHPKEDLQRAFAGIAERSQWKLPPPTAAFEGIVGAEPFPVTKKTDQIIRRLIGGVRRFRQLFSGNRSRSEVVATFLAVLELCRLRSLRVEEAENGELQVELVQVPGEQERIQEETT